MVINFEKSGIYKLKHGKDSDFKMNYTPHMIPFLDHLGRECLEILEQTSKVIEVRFKGIVGSWWYKPEHFERVD